MTPIQITCVVDADTFSFNLRCPKCGAMGQFWSSAVHFEHERKCTNQDCGCTWVPGEPIGGQQILLGNLKGVYVTEARK